MFLDSDDSEDEGDLYQIPRPREEGERARAAVVKRKDRFVNSIDTSLNPGNYNPMP